MVSAVRIGIEREWEGEAHWRACLTLVGLRPAKARFLIGEEGRLNNFKASLTTYLPVKPEAPNIITSNNSGIWLCACIVFFLDSSFFSWMAVLSCFEFSYAHFFFIYRLGRIFGE